MQPIRAFQLTDPSAKGPVRHFNDLIVYQKSFLLAARIYDLSRHWPGAERFALIDQIRRSSRSIGANIAEAWAKRRYPAHWVSKLTDAEGEANETEHWLACAVQHGYLAHSEFEEMKAALSEVGRLLTRLISKPGLFCQRGRDEAPAA